MTKVKKSIVILTLVILAFSLTVVKAEVNSTSHSSEAYANFRNVRSGSIGGNSLYRGQHPANGSSRSVVTNRLMAEKRILTVVNLSDLKKSLEKYFKKNKIAKSYYYRTLYDKGRVYTANLSTEHKGSSYRNKITSAMRFMAYHKGPYLVHCEVGRDRTGFAIILLGSFMGAPYRYLENDFARTYTERYHYSNVEAQKKAKRHVVRDLSYITGKSEKTDWTKMNLAMCADRFLRKGGMTNNEISALKRNLSMTYQGGGAGTAK